MTGDRAIRLTAVLAVVAVAAVAGYVSYFHAVDVVASNGEPGIIAKLYPAAIDGLIIAASMVLLDAARHGEDAPPLAWWLLGSGIAVTLAANVTYGAHASVAGALWSAWPALAFVGCYELLLLLARASARRSGELSEYTGLVAPPECRRNRRRGIPARHPDSRQSVVRERARYQLPSDPPGGGETTHPRARRVQRARTRTRTLRHPISRQRRADALGS